MLNPSGGSVTFMVPAIWKTWANEIVGEWAVQSAVIGDNLRFAGPEQHVGCTGSAAQTYKFRDYDARAMMNGNILATSHDLSISALYPCTMLWTATDGVVSRFQDGDLRFSSGSSGVQQRGIHLRTACISTFSSDVCAFS